MPSSGTKATGTVKAKLGPFMCSNCKKWAEGVCYDPEIAKDPENKADLMANGHVKREAGDCSNEFLSLADPREPGFKVPKQEPQSSMLDIVRKRKKK
jgi:hypothetical protein